MYLHDNWLWLISTIYNNVSPSKRPKYECTIHPIYICDRSQSHTSHTSTQIHIVVVSEVSQLHSKIIPDLLCLPWGLVVGNFRNSHPYIDHIQMYILACASCICTLSVMQSFLQLHLMIFSSSGGAGGKSVFMGTIFPACIFQPHSSGSKVSASPFHSWIW